MVKIKRQVFLRWQSVDIVLFGLLVLNKSLLDLQLFDFLLHHGQHRFDLFIAVLGGVFVDGLSNALLYLINDYAVIKLVLRFALVDLLVQTG